MKSDAQNLITDIEGILVGHAHDHVLKSGVTAILCDQGNTASIAVHGGGPGTRDSYLLEPENTVSGVDAIILSGGSAFGLDAPSGTQAWLRENARGYEIGPVRVPIVPGAILFDLINGGDKQWGRYPPYRELGYQAVSNADKNFQLGTVGAGTGALVANLKGGLGSASLPLDNGTSIAALFAVNAVGSPLIGDTRHFHAALFERDHEFGGYAYPENLSAQTDEPNIKFRQQTKAGGNTTIGVIATDALLSKAEAKRLAIAAHDGISRAIWPAHTPMDGDLIFAVATGKSGIKPAMADWSNLSAHAVSVTARAIARGVYCAVPHENDMFPTYREKFGKRS